MSQTVAITQTTSRGDQKAWSGVIGSKPLVLAGIFLIALVIRVGATAAFVGLNAPPRESANPDQLDYELLAYQLSTGHGYAVQGTVPTARRAPGTSLTLLPAYLVAGRSYAAGRLWFCMLSALTCVATALIADRLFGALPALLAGIGLAIYPGHFYNAMHFVSEGPYCFYLSVAILATIISLRKADTRWDVAAGVAWAMAVLTRPQAIFILPIAVVVVFWARWSGRGSHQRRLIVQTCVVLALMAPWVVRNAIVMGKPTLTTVGGFTFWGANNELLLTDPTLQGDWITVSTLRTKLHALPPGEVDAESAAWRYGWQFVRGNMTFMPHLMAMKLYRLITPFSETENRVAYWCFGISWLALGPLVLIGAVLAWKSHRTGAVVLLLPLIGLVLCAMVFYGSGRFRDSAAPVLVVLAVLPVAAVVKTVSNIPRRPHPRNPRTSL